MADSDPVDSLLPFPNLLWETISISQFALGRNAKKMEQLRFMRNVLIELSALSGVIILF